MVKVAQVFRTFRISDAVLTTMSILAGVASVALRTAVTFRADTRAA
jgi:hypothetical protein